MARRAPGSAAGRGSISRQPTLVDVAQASGVSRQTVSNAINAPQRLDPVTLARVRDAIDRLGYTPNRTARSLRARSSRFIGYRIMPFDPVRSSPVTDQFLHALAQAASREGYLILAFTPEDEPDELETYAELWRTGSVDGFVLSDVGHHDERARLLLDLDVPFVAFGRTRLPRPHSWVDVDPISAGKTTGCQRSGLPVGGVGWWPRGCRGRSPTSCECLQASRTVLQQPRKCSPYGSHQRRSSASTTHSRPGVSPRRNGMA